jgi:dTDP-4-dehydrorhamnose 3,5-epimerase
MVQDQNVKQRRSLVEYPPTARGPPVRPGRGRAWEDPSGFGRNAGRLDPSKLSDLPTHCDRPPTMLFRPLDIPGLFLIELERMEDERGFFSRVFCSDTFLQRGLCTDFAQWSVSFNKRSGTLRGLHFQAPPQEEIKLVSCTRGAVFDVAVDLRSGSPSWGKWAGVELSANNGSTLYIPAGFAHGFQTLTDDAEVRYHISERYHPEAARGVRWDDPDLAIAWPKAEERVISSRDQTLPRLRDL